jgi:hypothetical protein
VSAGIGAATRAGGGGGGGGGSARPDRTRLPENWNVCYDAVWRAVPCRYVRVASIAGGAYALTERTTFRREAPDNGPRTAKFHFYAGAQKVAESDGAVAIDLAVTDKRFRIGGTFTRYFERQPGNAMLRMSMPTLMGGIRIDDMGSTAVYLEGGVAHARTDGDAMGDSSITGPIAGLRVEHDLSKDISLLGDVQQMWFDDDIKASAGRIGVRYRYVQASLRVLDFNVGPALYGPEVGVRF